MEDFDPSSPRASKNRYSAEIVITDQDQATVVAELQAMGGTA